MSSEWSKVKIDEIGDVKSGKCLPLGHTLIEEPTNFPYIRLVDVADGRVQRDDLQFLKPETRACIRRYVVNSGDVCLAIVGHTIGMVFYVEHDFDDVNLTENAARITAFKEFINSKYLYYYLTSPLGQEAIQARKVGSAQGKLPLYNIKSLEIEIPPRQSQDRVVAFLEALDDRITLLRETNATLEAIAQALFKSWFVDFDPIHAKQQGQPPEGIDETTAALFPDSFEELELGLVPKGWRVGSLGSISDVGIGKTPPRKEAHWFSENPADVRWVSIRDMGTSGAFISQTSEYLTAESIKRFNVRQVPNNTVLLSFKMTIGRVAITEGEMTTNEAIAHCKLTAQSPLSSEYIYLHLKQFDYRTLSSTSSIADAVNSKTVKAIPILIPDATVVMAFNDAVRAIFERIKTIQQQAQTLTTLRDILLPRLISGQLCLPEASSIS